MEGEFEGRREYWYRNGQKWQEAEFHKGELDGPGRTWFRDGSVQSIWRAANGKIVAHVDWREDGTLEKEEGDIQLLLGGKTLEAIRKNNHRPSSLTNTR